MKSLKNKDFISLMNFNPKELEYILKLAMKMKSGADKRQKLSRKTIGLMFSVPSTRTRVSFQAGVRQLGGHAEYLNVNDLQLANKESFVDTARVMSRYLDALVVRMYDMDQYGKGRELLNLIAENSTIPVINGLDDKDHPCQVMADILTIREKFGPGFKKRKIVMTWGYSTRFKSPGVPHSMLVAASLLGMDVTFAYPRGYELDAEYVRYGEETARRTGARISYSNDLLEASRDSDVIYVKNWKSLTMPKEEDARVRNEIRHDWCVSERHFDVAKPGCLYMDCLPQIRGEGVTAEIMDGERSVIYDEAENRLHVQKAILSSLL